MNAQIERLESRRLLSGALDPSFGSAGTVLLQSHASNFAIQADGKIIVPVANDGVTRLSASGSVDTSFGSHGQVSVPFSPAGATARSVGIEPDGKIILAEDVDGGTGLVRLLANGTLDTNFGPTQLNPALQGEVYVSGLFAPRVLIQQDGRFLVAGSPVQGATLNGTTIYRLNKTGLPDTTFGSNGAVTVFDAVSNYGMALQSDGKLLLTGTNQHVIRLLPTGALDKAFGSAGEATVPDVFPTTVAVEADGKIVVGGFSAPQPLTGNDFGLARLTAAGKLDAGFGVHGELITDFAGQPDFVNALAIQQDGKIVAGGDTFSVNANNYVGAVARYNGNGTIDASFGAGGIETLLSLGRIRGLALQPDGNIVGLDDRVNVFRLLTGPASISGNVFNDTNANGKKDAKETGLSGWTVYLDANNNGKLDPSEITVKTDSSGNYRFSNLSPGTYHVREVVQAGYKLTLPAGGAYVSKVSAGQQLVGDNFGDVRASGPGKITGRLFNDLNGNGRQDARESGLVGWSVFIDANGNGVFDSTEILARTDANGNYAFDNLSPGTYIVRQVPQQGWSITSPTKYSLVVTSGQSIANVNFGDRATAAKGRSHG